MEDLEFEYDMSALVLGQNLICGKWTIFILWFLSKDKKRFKELHKFLRHTSRSMLTKQLQELEHNGLIQRDVYGEVPVRVEYSLTEIGEKLIPVLYALSDWSKEYVAYFKEDGISDVDFLREAFIKDKYKYYKDYPSI
jgi:DNA-binding HxlR family transcriptional regulator